MKTSNIESRGTGLADQHRTSNSDKSRAGAESGERPEVGAAMAAHELGGALRWGVHHQGYLVTGLSEASAAALAGLLNVTVREFAGKCEGGTSNTEPRGAGLADQHPTPNIESISVPQGGTEVVSPPNSPGAVGAPGSSCLNVKPSIAGDGELAGFMEVRHGTCFGDANTLVGEARTPELAAAIVHIWNLARCRPMIAKISGEQIDAADTGMVITNPSVEQFFDWLEGIMDGAMDGVSNETRKMIGLMMGYALSRLLHPKTGKDITQRRRDAKAQGTEETLNVQRSTSNLQPGGAA